MPSKKKKYNARFPPARIKKIMQMDEEVGKVAATVPVIISRALELFIESLIHQSTQTTLSKNAKTLSTSHIKQTIESQEKYHFLRELVANVPDYQVEEEGAGASTGNHSNSDDQAAGGKRPKGRPRKQKEEAAAVQKRGQGKRKKESSESSESEQEQSEATDDADEESDEEASAPGPSFSVSPLSWLPSPSRDAEMITISAESRNGGPSMPYRDRSAAYGERPPASATTTTLSNPPPLSELLGHSPVHQHQQQQQHHQRYQQQHALHQQVYQQHNFQQQQEQQQNGDGSLPATSMGVSATMPAPALMPTSMPSMYQGLPGMSPHMYHWSGAGLPMTGLMQHGFPPIHTQAGAFPSLPPQALGAFPNMGFPGIGFPGISQHSLSRYPVSGVPSGLYPGAGMIGDLGVVGLQAMATPHPATVSSPNASRADDDYDT